MRPYYYLFRNTIQYGPFTLEQLTQQGLTSADFVWHEGLPDWRSPASLPELAPFVIAIPQRPFATPQVTFGEAISVCFKKFATFKGRARRSEYWWFQLFAYLINFCTGGLGLLVTFIPDMAVTTRRLHDTGLSGWWLFCKYISFILLITCIILINSRQFSNYHNMFDDGSLIFSFIFIFLGILIFIFMFIDSGRGANRYGDSPKYPSEP